MYKVAIIGAGSIGASKPDHVDFPGGENILTHAHAVCAHPRAELNLIVDPDKAKLDAAYKKWQPKFTAPSINNASFIAKKEDILKAIAKNDIVIIATPTETHHEAIHEALNICGEDGLVIAEKPFCSSIKDAKDARLLLMGSERHVIVDYIRRFTPGVRTALENFRKGKYGKALNARCLYTRGMKRDGCHAIDFMRYFFGECNEFKVLSGLGINDYDEDDPTRSYNARFELCEHVAFQPCDGRLYGVFEIDICFEKCRIRFIDNCLQYEIYPVREQNEWGHASLSYALTDVVRMETGLNTALYNLLDNAVGVLDGAVEPLCTMDDALAVHKVLG